MNQEESICRPYIRDISCFETEIPDHFNSSSKTKDYCSFKFPPGYSIYVEEFILDDPGPDNFVLLDGQLLKYRPKLRWEDREHTLWKNLHRYNPLNFRSTLRPNIACAQTLKVFFLTLYLGAPGAVHFQLSS